MGANGQLEIEKQKRLPIIKNFLPTANLIPIATNSSVAQLSSHVADEGSTTVQTIPVLLQRQGKKCWNINCPDHSRYTVLPHAKFCGENALRIAINVNQARAAQFISAQITHVS